jgi:hypothetical protein
MKGRHLPYIFAGVQDDFRDHTKRFTKSGKLFNNVIPGLKIKAQYEANGPVSSLAPWYANALHDNQDLVMLYDSDGNPEFKQDHLTYRTTGITGSYPWDIKGDLFKNLARIVL